MRDESDSLPPTNFIGPSDWAEERRQRIVNWAEERRQHIVDSTWREAEQSAIEDIPHSPITGPDGLTPEVGATEVRRARVSVEIYYRSKPGDFVDIQARICDALTEIGGDRHDTEGDAIVGDVLVAADLIEHVRFVDGSRS